MKLAVHFLVNGLQYYWNLSCQLDQNLNKTFSFVSIKLINTYFIAFFKYLYAIFNKLIFMFTFECLSKCFYVGNFVVNKVLISYPKNPLLQIIEWMRLNSCRKDDMAVSKNKKLFTYPIYYVNSLEIRIKIEYPSEKKQSKHVPWQCQIRSYTGLTILRCMLKYKS